MRRTRLPLDQKLLQPPGHSVNDTADLDAASGKSAGVPLFLDQSSQTPTIDPEIDDELAGGAEEMPEEEPTRHEAQDAGDRADAEAMGDLLPAPAQVADVSGTGVETEVSAYGVALRGRTDARFSSSFRTAGVRTRAATGCDNCADSECVHVSGVVVSTFHVTTTVTLPSVSDFPDLTACQRRRVRDGINNVLAPHEQQHVAAFRAYNGTVRTPFDLTICRSDLDARIQELHNSVESERQSSAQAESDALDPFVFNVDLDCED